MTDHSYDSKISKLFYQNVSRLVIMMINVQARSGGSRKGIGRRKISYSTRPSSSTKRSSRSKRLSEHEKEDSKRPFHVSFN